jgi:hypothetical protein
MDGAPFASFESNTSEPEAGDSSVWAPMYYFMGSRKRFLERYHRHSNLETAYPMILGKCGDSLCRA